VCDQGAQDADRNSGNATGIYRQYARRRLRHEQLMARTVLSGRSVALDRRGPRVLHEHAMMKQPTVVQIARHLRRSILAAALSLSARSQILGAQVVVNGGAPNQGSGWNIFDDNRASTVFSVASATTFDAIRFWGILPDGPPYSPNIFWQILN